MFVVVIFLHYFTEPLLKLPANAQSYLLHTFCLHFKVYVKFLFFFLVLNPLSTCVLNPIVSKIRCHRELRRCYSKYLVWMVCRNRNQLESWACLWTPQASYLRFKWLPCHREEACMASRFFLQCVNQCFKKVSCKEFHQFSDPFQVCIAMNVGTEDS